MAPADRSSAPPTPLTAVVLAAGAGVRFGSPKQLAELDGRPLLAHVVDTALAHPAVDDVVVVLGARADAVRAALPADRFSGRIVVCPDWADGPSASLRCGLEALGDADALVLLGDQPRLPAAAIDRVVATPGALVRATVDGRPGHPVLLRGSWPARIAALSDEQRRATLRTDAVAVEVGDLGGSEDVDRPADLERLRGRSG